MKVKLIVCIPNHDNLYCIIMKKIYLTVKASILMLTLISILPLRSEPMFPTWFQVSINVNSGIIYGNIYEYVFNPNVFTTDGTLYQLSDLDWEIKPIVYDGFTLQFDFADLLYLKHVQSFGLNKNLGTMEDSDYTNNDGIKNYFSKHDNLLYKYYSYEFEFGLSKEISNVFLSAAIKYNYQQYHMAAHNGYLQYPPGSTPVYIYGDNILYDVKFYNPAVTFSLGYRLADWLLPVIHFDYSLLSSSNSVDTHVARDLQFYDRCLYLTYINIGGSINFTFKNNITLSINYSNTMVPKSSGESSWRDLDNDETSTPLRNVAGIELKSQKFELSVGYTIK